MCATIGHIYIYDQIQFLILQFTFDYYFFPTLLKVQLKKIIPGNGYISKIVGSTMLHPVLYKIVDDRQGKT